METRGCRFPNLRSIPSTLLGEAELPDDFRDRAEVILAEQGVEFAIDSRQRARTFLDQRRTDLHRLRAGQVRDVRIASAVDAADRNDIEEALSHLIERVYLR
jgi:hypothetical protein